MSDTNTVTRADIVAGFGVTAASSALALSNISGKSPETETETTEEARLRVKNELRPFLAQENFRKEFISVERAKELLLLVDEALLNRKQRKFSRTLMMKYAREMLAGTFQTTHQPLCISKSGFLIDGQHRLRAIVETGIGMALWIGLGFPDKSFEATDAATIRPKSVATQMAADQTATLEFVRRKLVGVIERNELSRSQLIAFKPLLEDELIELSQNCARHSPRMTSAPIRAAVLIRAIEASQKGISPSKDWFYDNFNGLLAKSTADIKSLAVRQLFHILDSTNIKDDEGVVMTAGQGKIDKTFDYAWQAFDYANKDKPRWRISHGLDRSRAEASVILAKHATFKGLNPKLIIV